MSTPSDPNKPPTPKAIHFVALGSSFAAGPGLPPYSNHPAGRSLRNYANILSTLYPQPTKLTDLTVSGATLLNILSEPQTSFRGGHIYPPQLSIFPSDADIVTITAGGNDLGYIGGVTYEVLGASWWGRLVRWLFAVPPEVVGLRAEDVAGRFVEVIDEIWKKAPNAKIYLVEYLTLFGPKIQPWVDIALAEDRIEHYRAVSETLRDAYRLAAGSRPSVEVIPVMEKSQGHGLGSEEPWVEGLSLRGIWERKAPFHPNAKGMENVAQMIHDSIVGCDAVQDVGES